MVGWLQTSIILVLVVVIFAAALWAFIQVLRYPPEAYVAAGKRTKNFWLAIVGGGLVLAFLSLPPNFGFGLGFLFEIAASAATIIFFVDVLPRLREVHRPGTSRPRDTNRGGW